MAKINRGTLIWLFFLGLFALIPIATTEHLEIIPYSGEGTAMFDDPFNPGQPTPAAMDIYVREKCYCEPDPSWTLETPDAGAYMHIEYFNHYHQFYFSLEFICKTEIGVSKEDDRRCSPSFHYDDDSYFRIHRDLCYYGCVTNNETGFEWCYEASRDYMENDMTFVGSAQKQLTDVGDRVFENKADEVQYCDEHCKECVDPGLTAYKPWAPGRTLNEDNLDMKAMDDLHW